MVCAPRSIDMSVIEHLWSVVDNYICTHLQLQKLRGYCKHLSILHDNISTEIFQSPVKSMQRRGATIPAAVSRWNCRILLARQCGYICEYVCAYVCVRVCTCILMLLEHREENKYCCDRKARIKRIKIMLH